MTHELLTHPTTGSIAIDRLTASIERTGPASLRLRYEVEGRIRQIIVPGPAEPVRTAKLWEATCFELFLRGGSGNGYREFNFSPSGQWAAYAFDTYRGGMNQAPLPEAPVVTVEADAGRLVVEVVLAVDLPDAPYAANLTAVVDEIGGLKSYWAAGHPSEAKPDFHHPAGFALKLP